MENETGVAGAAVAEPEVKQVPEAVVTDFKGFVEDQKMKETAAINAVVELYKEDGFTKDQIRAKLIELGVVTKRGRKPGQKNAKAARKPKVVDAVTGLVVQVQGQYDTLLAEKAEAEQAVKDAQEVVTGVDKQIAALVTQFPFLKPKPKAKAKK